jgi:hypothetical protein
VSSDELPNLLVIEDYTAMVRIKQLSSACRSTCFAKPSRHGCEVSGVPYRI